MTENKHQHHNSLIFLTNRLGRLLANEARKRTNMQALGLMPHHMGILSDLWNKDGVRQQDLVVSIIKDKATIARALDALEEANIVLRVTDPNDKRNKRIYLTHKGKALKGEFVPKVKAMEEEIINQLDKKEYQTCLKVLEQIHEILLK